MLLWKDRFLLNHDPGAGDTTPQDGIGIMSGWLRTHPAIM